MIKKRNLDPSLVQWIMQQTGLGPGIGELHWVAPASSATSQFRTQLQRWGVEQNYKIHLSPADAHPYMVDGRNDIMLIMPSNYVMTGAAPLTWSNSYTHMLGLYHPAAEHCQRHGVILRTSSTTGVFAMQVTGSGCQFHNVAFENFGAATAAVCAVKESGHSNYFKSCTMMGMVKTQQSQNADCCTLWIDTTTSDAGKADRFDDCIIGDPGTAKRTVQNGIILMGPTGTIGAGASMTYKGCRILTWAEDTDPAALKIVADYCADRMILFDDCTFYNFKENHSSTEPAYVVRDGCNTTHDILFKNSVHHGYTAWTNNQTHSFVTMPAVDESGGESTPGDAA